MADPEKDGPSLELPSFRLRRPPALTGTTAAVAAGIATGLLLVVAVYGFQCACALVRGTSTCGGTGVFLLMIALGLAAFVGATLLRAGHVPEPGGTSILATGVLTVLILVFLVESLFDWWMVLAIPALSVVSYVASHWLTTQVADPG